MYKHEYAWIINVCNVHFLWICVRCPLFISLQRGDYIGDIAWLQIHWQYYWELKKYWSTLHKVSLKTTTLALWPLGQCKALEVHHVYVYLVYYHCKFFVWCNNCGFPDCMSCSILHYGCFSMNKKEYNFFVSIWMIIIYRRWSFGYTPLTSKTKVQNVLAQMWSWNVITRWLYFK